MSIAIGTDDRAGYITPEFQKPSIRYEDKIIPTLRHRIQADANIGRLSRSEADLPRMMSTVPSDDVIPELNQAEIIEANQMMTVFDQVLVSSRFYVAPSAMQPCCSRWPSSTIAIMPNAKRRSTRSTAFSADSPAMTTTMLLPISVRVVSLSLECYAWTCSRSSLIR